MTKFYRVCHILLALLIKMIFRLRIIGLENEPATGAHLVCANHMSLWDPVFMGACLKKRQVRFMAKAELFNIPFVGILVKALGAFPVKRGGTDITAIRNTIDLLNKGECVGIFPQGTRHPGVDPRETEVKGGAGMCAFRGKCDVLPVAIVNKYRRMKLFTKNYVIIGKPIKYEELGITDGDKAQFEAASRVIFDRICDMCDEYREKILR